MYCTFKDTCGQTDTCDLKGNTWPRDERFMMKWSYSLIKSYYERDKNKIHNPEVLCFKDRILAFLDTEQDHEVYSHIELDGYYPNHFIDLSDYGNHRFNLTADLTEDGHIKGKKLCLLSKYLKDKEIPEDWNIYDINPDLNFRYL